MRGLLCVPQSSKEQLRRSRTESSGAAPAIEELPGVARQCKARRAAMRRSRQHGSVFSRAGRSGGSQALQLPRATDLPRQPAYLPAPDRVPQKSEIPVSVQTFPIGEEVWRASGPPAPTPPVSPRQPGLFPPLPTAYHRSRNKLLVGDL